MTLLETGVAKNISWLILAILRYYDMNELNTSSRRIGRRVGKGIS